MIEALVWLIVWLVVLGCVYAFARWAIPQLGLPPIFLQIVTVLVALVAFVMVLNLVLGFAGHPFIELPR